MGLVSTGSAMQIKGKDIRTLQLALEEMGIRVTQAKIRSLGYLMNLYNEFNLSYKDQISIFLAFARNRAEMAKNPEAQRFWEEKVEALERFHHDQVEH